MTDYNSESYTAGRSGGAYQAGYDSRDYQKGQADKQAEDQFFTDRVPKANVDGPTFGIMAMAPVLFLFYPVLGLTLWAGFGLALLVGMFVPIPVALSILIGIGLCIAAWMPGFRWEKKISQSRAYRFLRWIMRIIAPIALLVAMIASNKYSGGTMFFAILLLIPFFFVCRTFDRLFFPVWAEVEKKQAMNEMGIPDKRPLLKRVFYSALWLFPYLALYGVVVGLGSLLLSEDATSAAALRQQYQPYIIVVMYGSWLLFSILGWLPGTAKHRKSYIDQSVLLANRESER